MIHRVEYLMGTAIGIDVRDADVPDAAVDEAFVRLAAIEARFSTYRPDSEVSRYGRGEIDDDDLERRVSRGAPTV